MGSFETTAAGWLILPFKRLFSPSIVKYAVTRAVKGLRSNLFRQQRVRRVGVARSVTSWLTSHA